MSLLDALPWCCPSVAGGTPPEKPSNSKMLLPAPRPLPATAQRIPVPPLTRAGAIPLDSPTNVRLVPPCPWHPMRPTRPSPQRRG